MSIGDWMETPVGGKITGYAFGFGAAVVIVGALFKIMHWPGASVVLTTGMGTEALLFVITAFGKPHPVYHWDRVYPVISDNTPEGAAFADGHVLNSAQAPVAAGGSVGGGNFVPAAGNATVSVAGGNVGGGAVVGGNSLGVIAGTDISSLSEEDIEKLNKGIGTLSSTAEKLSKLGEASDGANKFLNNLNVANSSVEKYNNSMNQISDTASTLVSSYQGIAADLNNARQNSSAFAQEMGNINRTLSSTSSAYELQLKAAAAANAQMESLKQNTAKLNSQIANLNNIYGNMLNALA